MILIRQLTILVAAAALAGADVTFAQYAVGTDDATFVDPDRDDRAVPVDLYYPAVTAGPDQPPAAPPSGGFPAVAFGHGYLMPASAYAWLGQRLAADGFVVAMPRTCGELFPSHATFALDLAFAGRRLRALGDDASSPFFGRLSDLAGVMGHSMGGGCSLLAAAGDPTVSAVANLAAAETNPSAIAVCGTISAPALLFAGENDCVTPPSAHQLPMFAALGSNWRTLITLDGASHCQFAASNFACSLGEACAAEITRAQQQDLTWLLLRPWLHAVLYSDAGARLELQALLQSTPGFVFAQGGGITDIAADAEATGLRLTATPNPFNPTTALTARLDRSGPAQLEILDPRGRRVRALLDGALGAGARTVTWDGRDDQGRSVAAGIYVARLTSAGQAATTRLVLVR
jgi:alpha-beta hydrolase superfamily lysophospholipase